MSSSIRVRTQTIVRINIILIIDPLPQDSTLQTTSVKTTPLNFLVHIPCLIRQESMVSVPFQAACISGVIPWESIISRLVPQTQWYNIYYIEGVIENMRHNNFSLTSEKKNLKNNNGSVRKYFSLSYNISILNYLLVVS